MFNGLDITDETALFTAGAVSGAGAFVDLTTTQLLAQIDVGDNASLISAGDMELEALGENDIYLESYSETYGLGTVALGLAPFAALGSLVMFRRTAGPPPQPGYYTSVFAWWLALVAVYRSYEPIISDLF